MRHHQNPPHRTRPRRLRWIAAAAITAAAAVASSTAAADARTDTPAPVDVAVASYAADYGVSHAEAQRRLDRIPSLQEILASIREAEDARLAGWGIDHQGTFTGWVWLTGQQPPSGSAAHIADAHPDAEIRTGAAHSRSELLAAQRGLFQDIEPTGHITDGPESLAQVKRIVTYTSIDMRANAVEIGIDPALASNVPGDLVDPTPVAVTDEALIAKIAEVTQQFQHQIKVAFVVADGRDISSFTSFAGGEAMSGCTAGFAAQATDGGAYGMITAGHCGDDGPNETKTFRMHNIELPHDYGWASVNADAQFHHIPAGSSHVLRDDYLCDTATNWYCDISRNIARSNMMNDFVCHTGKNSGISCATVVAIDYQPIYAGACRSSRNDVTRCNQVFVKIEGTGLRGCKGDSGGPWWRSSHAYGIHMGGVNPTNDCNATITFAFFSAIGEVEDFLDVEILTDGNVTIN